MMQCSFEWVQLLLGHFEHDVLVCCMYQMVNK